MPKILAFVALALVLALPTTVRSEEPTTPPLELPRIGTLGQAPEADASIRVELFRDGTIRLDGSEPLGLHELRVGLQQRVADPRRRGEDAASLVPLLVVADQDVPWGLTQWVLMTAAHPRVQIHQIYFAARPHGSDEVGAIACPLPKDRPVARTTAATPVLRLKMAAPPETVADDPAALFAAIARQARAVGGAGKVHVDITTPPPFGPRVATGSIVRVLDVLLRAGIRTVAFSGSAMPMGADFGTVAWLRKTVAAWRAEGGPAWIKLGTKRVGQADESYPVPEAFGLLRRVHGFGDPSHAVGGIEEVELEEELLPAEGRSAGDWEETGPPVVAESFRARLRDPASGAPDRRRRAIEDALNWLATHQAADGLWDADGFGGWSDGARTEGTTDGPGKSEHDVGVTGLSLLAFLGGGYTHRDPHPHAETVKKGLRYLKGVQDAEGCYGPRASPQYAYDHAIATLAMVEAYGMTGSGLLRASAQRGLDFSAGARNPYFAWRYGIRPRDNDTSITYWMLAGITAAQRINQDAEAAGRSAPFTIDEASFEGAKAWVDKMTEPDFGRVGYIQRGGSSARPQELVDRFPADRSEAMTAAGICIRVAAGEDPGRSLFIRKGAQLLLGTKPEWDETGGRIDMMAWYLGSQALFHVGGSAWKGWKRALENTLLRRQRREGGRRGLGGTWDPAGPWGSYGGRVYATALMALALER